PEETHKEFFAENRNDDDKDQKDHQNTEEYSVGEDEEKDDRDLMM
ncbi:hypothetical protein TNIN_138861, partial [Trichonephila inaurata madagascariensis]